MWPTSRPGRFSEWEKGYTIGTIRSLQTEEVGAVDVLIVVLVILILLAVTGHLKL